MAAAYAPADAAPLRGGALVLAGFLLAVGNFMVVLDMTIANVSVPNIAGSLAVAPNQGTCGDLPPTRSPRRRIVVPLTGWLALEVRRRPVFVAGMLGFSGSARRLSAAWRLRWASWCCSG